MPANSVIQLRRGTAAQWSAANPVLALNEPGTVVDGSGRAVSEKRGDGVTAWSSLPDYAPGTGTFVPARVLPPPNGVDDTSAWAAARDAAGVGGWIVAPAAASAYILNDLTFSVDGQTWECLGTVKRKAAASGSTNMWNVTADGVKLRLGSATIDGNASNQTAGGTGLILITGPNVVVDDPTFQNVYSGTTPINGSGCNRVKIRRPRGTVNTTTPFIFIHVSTGHMQAPEVLDVDLIQLGTGQGVTLHGSQDGTYAIRRPKVTGRVELPTTSPNIAVELWGAVQGGRVDCQTYGGYMGVSLDHCIGTHSTGTVEAASTYGVELASSSFCNVDMTVDGASATLRGAVLDGTASAHNRIAGTIRNCTYAGVAGNGALDTQIDAVINCPGAAAGLVYLQNCTGFAIDGYFDGGGSTSWGVQLDTSTDGSIRGTVKGCTGSWLLLYSGSAFTVRNIVAVVALTGSTPSAVTVSGAAVKDASVRVV